MFKFQIFRHFNAQIKFWQKVKSTLADYRRQNLFFMTKSKKNVSLESDWGVLET